MKKYLLHAVMITAICLFNFTSINAQSVLWAKQGISEGFENGNAIATDDSGNVYVTGQFEFTSVFDNYTLTSYGQHDILLVKYDPNGVIKWIRKAGGPGGDIGNGIGVDAQHNVYVTGEIEDSVKFGPGVSLVSNGANDGFIAKYDVNGNVLWAKGFGAPIGSDKGRALAVSPSGNVYVTGNYTYNTTFGSTVLSTLGGNDMFVFKMNTNGDYVWAKSAGGNSQDRGYGLAIDASENVYVTGTFTHSATFRNTTITNSGNHSTFLAKYDPSGLFQWVKGAGDCCDTTKANSIALDNAGNIYLAGYFMDHTTFGSYQFVSRGLSDVFVVKYDPTGNVLWAKQGGGIDEDAGYGIAVDNANQRVYVTGLVRETGTFGALPYTIYGYKDIFIAAYDLSGTEAWLQLYGGHYRDVGAAIVATNTGHLYSTGLFNDIAHFGPFTLTGYPNQPWADFYTDKILPPMAPAVTNQASNLSLTTGACSDLKLSFTPGNGMNRIIVAHEGSAVNAFPVNGNNYSADNIFGHGTNLGNNNYVVYCGTGNNVSVTGLTAGSTYYFSVFEYNGSGVLANYMTSPQASVNGTSTLFPITITGLQNSICNGETLDLVASEATAFNWSPNTGLSSTTGAMVNASPATTTTYLVKGITADGCEASTTFTINVNALPTVSLSAISPLCSNASPIALMNGIPAGGVYDGNGINAGMFDPAAAGAGITIMHYVYSDANGCSNDAITDIHVNSAPVVTMSALPVLCRNGAPVALNIGTPVGGVYTGAGVSNGMFNPSIGVGTFQVNYFYTDNNGCMSSGSTNAVVQPLPVINLGNDRNVCADQTTTVNAGAGFSSYRWSNGATTQSIVVDSSGIGLGTKQVFVVVTNAAGCQSSSTILVHFDICAGMNNPIADFHEISVFPNPFSNSFTFVSEKEVTFSIYDMTGRLLDKKENVNGSISAGENFSPGVYFVEVISGMNRKTFSVVKTE